MKRVFFGLVILIGFTACGIPSDREMVASSNTAQMELDSLKREKVRLQQEIKELKATTNDSDSAVKQPFMTDGSVEEPKTKPIIEESPVLEQPIKETIEQSVQKNNDKGAVHYFKGTKKVAVRITPWKGNQREVICYDLKGNITYSFEDVRRDYTVFTEVVSFHENGAANRIHVSSNPGASLYYYETNYSFDEENYPLKKEEIEYPQTLDKMLDNVRTWNREKRVWL